jgi:hypothetical protein
MMVVFPARSTIAAGQQQVSWRSTVSNSGDHARGTVSVCDAASSSWTVSGNGSPVFHSRKPWILLSAPSMTSPPQYAASGCAGGAMSAEVRPLGTGSSSAGPSYARAHARSGHLSQRSQMYSLLKPVIVVVRA